MAKKKSVFNIEKPPTLREKIVYSIRDAIIKGDLKPGERVAESSLSASLGISRTPIREAIRQLESEGFLTVEPRKGATVSSFSDRNIREFYEIKSILEGHAARCAALNLSEADIERMQDLNEQMKKRLLKRDANALLRLHNEFHDVFLASCGNERLRDLVNNLVRRFQRFRYLLSISGELEEALRQHDLIIEAFRARDPDLAAKLVRDNALKGGESLLDWIKKARDG